MIRRENVLSAKQISYYSSTGFAFSADMSYNIEQWNNLFCSYFARSLSPSLSFGSIQNNSFGQFRKRTSSNFESLKLRSLRVHVPTLRAYLRAYQRVLSAFVLTRQRILWAYVLMCFACLRANVPMCLACLRAHVPTCHVYLRAHVLYNFK